MSIAELAFEEAMEDKSDKSSMYLSPNEDTLLWRDMLKGKRIERAAAICSSGEVGLFAILPTVRKELVLIDHSYGALSIAIYKYLLIREHGPTTTLKLLTSEHRLASAVNAITGQIPTKLSSGRQLVGYSATILNKEWSKLPLHLLRRSGAKLGKVSFIHGDMKELAKRPHKFDALYLSNALEHYRHGGDIREACKSLDSILSPGGYVMAAVNRNDYYGCRSSFKEVGWEVVQDVEAVNASIRWQQVLLRKPL